MEAQSTRDDADRRPAPLVGGPDASGPEGRVAQRLERHLAQRGVELIHDLRMPGTRARIDHVAVGPGGVTVIETRRYRGKVRVRGSRLMVDGRDRTRLVESVGRQVDVVRAELALSAWHGIDVRGAICWIHTQGLPFFGQSLDGVAIDGPRRTARLARRDGDLRAGEVAAIVGHLRRVLC